MVQIRETNTLSSRKPTSNSDASQEVWIGF